MELIDYNWTTDQSSSAPSDYVTEVTSYLKNVRMTNENTLSNVVAVTTYMEACKHIAERLKSELVEPPEISFTALKCFDMDLTCFENFTAQLQFPASDAETLRIVFIDVRQLVDVLLRMEFVQFVSMSADACKYRPSSLETLTSRVPAVYPLKIEL